jgi:hypothetical protein
MSEEELERKVLGRLRIDRRDFVKRALRGVAFTVPVIASFDMNSSLAEAKKQSRRGGPMYSPNGGPGYFGNGGYAGHSEHAFPYDTHHGSQFNWET